MFWGKYSVYVPIDDDSMLCYDADSGQIDVVTFVSASTDISSVPKSALIELKDLLAAQGGHQDAVSNLEKLIASRDEA